MAKKSLLPLVPIIAVPLGVAGFVFFRGVGDILKEKYYKEVKYKPYQPLPEGVLVPTKDQGPVVDQLHRPAGKRALLPAAKWIPQTYNNCGPATVSMVLQYFGQNVGQDTTKAALRTNPTDSNVFTAEIRDYLKTKGIESKLLYNGSIELIKTLISNGFYVVVEDTLHPNEDIGHTTIIRGFDDDQGVLVADDSFLGVGVTYPYEEFEEKQWKPFNREYLPVYAKDKEKVIRSIVGDSWDERIMFQNAIDRNNEAVLKDPKDLYAWFNLGTSYFGLMDYEKARIAFERSRELGWPMRLLWYQIQPVQTYNKLGEYEKALELADLGLRFNDSFAELHLEKAIAFKGLNRLEEAKREVETALSFAPNLKPASDYLASL